MSASDMPASDMLPSLLEQLGAAKLYELSVQRDIDPLHEDLLSSLHRMQPSYNAFAQHGTNLAQRAIDMSFQCFAVRSDAATQAHKHLGTVTDTAMLFEDAVRATAEAHAALALQTCVMMDALQELHKACSSNDLENALQDVDVSFAVPAGTDPSHLPTDMLTKAELDEVLWDLYVNEPTTEQERTKPAPNATDFLTDEQMDEILGNNTVVDNNTQQAAGPDDDAAPSGNDDSQDSDATEDCPYESDVEMLDPGCYQPLGFEAVDHAPAGPGKANHTRVSSASSSSASSSTAGAPARDSEKPAFTNPFLAAASRSGIEGILALVAILTQSSNANKDTRVTASQTSPLASGIDVTSPAFSERFQGELIREIGETLMWEEQQEAAVGR
ncbi:hypothetical protein N7539_003535 [Penicillium diatomitis]|uniref:Uncharacterized protein n=1 Tax=Penicillium diatomitis TaxID=2819901 RepID=A0A9W9XC42_9EURO|nr:uncharacterized protein N7539_003535 [Penicillium diatomitis]KAJ5488645.1 hypothetical protein N7539_003535 [Penicillium diatomitis]